MTSRPSSSPSPRLRPDLIRAATVHAHALREQAIDHAFGLCTAWLRRLFKRRGQLVVQEKPCLS